VVRGRALTTADAVRIAALSEQGAVPRQVTLVGVASAPASAQSSNPTGGDPTVFLPLGTPPNHITAWTRADNAAQLAGTVHRTLADLDPELPPLAVRTLERRSPGELFAMVAATTLVNEPGRRRRRRLRVCRAISW
jgi:hypothetical protein